VDRPSWDEYFLNIAKEVSTRSTCPRASVGAIIVKDNHILSTGYNGAPPREPHCAEVGCLMVNGHCERTVHAETNAIAQAAKHGVSVDGATLYCWSNRHHTDTPYFGEEGKKVANCIKCTQVIKSAGIIRVVDRR
jgi:dCMP deaminase